MRKLWIIKQEFATFQLSFKQQSQFKMKLDPLLEKQLRARFDKDNRTILFFTRVKMLIHIQEAQWQQNCSGILILYQRKYSYGFSIVSIQNLDINFDFEIYSNFKNYTKYIESLRALIFLAPSQLHCLKIMFVVDGKADFIELRKNLVNIEKIATNENEFLNEPDVQQIMRKVPIDQNLLVKSKQFRDTVEKLIREHFQKAQGRKADKKTSGFKYYSLGRQEWKIDLQEQNYLKQKYEADILQQLDLVQKQVVIKMNAK